MLIYRFRVNSEDHDEFVREICIQPGQRFIDFYQCLLESAEMIPAMQASFFMTDKKYKKDREISLNPLERKIRKYDAELDEVVLATIVPTLMKDARLKDYIEDPHQRMIFEYQGRENMSFLIELVKIMQSDIEGLYPKCVKWVGELPKKPEVPVAETAEPKVDLREEPVVEAVPVFETLAKLDGIVENEEELAEIEDNLGKIIFGEERGTEEPATDAPKLQKKTPLVRDTSMDVFEEEDAEDEDEKEDFSDGMEHLEDYDNIENIGMDYGKYRDDGYDD